MVGDFELAALHENSRARKRSLERAGIAPPHDPAAMIEMQMRHDQMRDVAGLHPERAQMLRQPSVAMIENLALDVLRRLPIPVSTRIASLPLIISGQVRLRRIRLRSSGGWLCLPEFARHHAEHASAVVAPQPVGEKRDLNAPTLIFGGVSAIARP